MRNPGSARKRAAGVFFEKKDPVKNRVRKGKRRNETQ